MLEKDSSNGKGTGPQTLVEIDNITKIFSKTNWAIKKVSLTINKGDCIAIVGANGSGKSILAKLIGNQVPQTSGIIDYFFNEDNIFKAIGYQGREQSWPGGFKVKDVYNLYKAIHNVKNVEWISKLFSTFAIDTIMEKTLSKLNIINLQLFAMFLAMLHQPELLIIDEMSASIGFDVRMKIIGLFKEYISMGGTIIIVYPDDYAMNAVCNRIITMHAGEILEDLPLNEAIKEYGSTFEYVRLTVEHIKTTSRKKKIDPAFVPLTDKYAVFYSTLMNHYEFYFKGGFNSDDANLNTKVKDAFYYITLSREVMYETILSSITVASVERTERILVKVQKVIKSILKDIKYYQKHSEKPIRHLTTLINNLDQICIFINTKVRPIFKDNEFILNNEIINIESSKSERKKLRILKKRYIREEMRIIKLERSKLKRRKELAAMSAEDRSILKSKLLKDQISLENEITSAHLNVVDALNDVPASVDKTVTLDINNNVGIAKDTTVISSGNEVVEPTMSHSTIVSTETMKTRINDELQAIDELDQIESNDDLTISSFFDDVDSSDNKNKKEDN